MTAANDLVSRIVRYLSSSTYVEPLLGPRSARARHAGYLSAPPTIEHGVDAIRKRWPDLSGDPTSAPIFILSAGWRSGSTFLQRWLMTDDRVLIWGEPYKYSRPIHSLARQLQAFALANWPDDSFFADRYCPREAMTREFVGNMYAPIHAFVAAHRAYFDHLFVQPAVGFGKTRWGLKEISLTVDHAAYLKWLFPRARFLFLYRNPFDAYRSYRQWRDWYVSWPDAPVFTPRRFGRCWRTLTADFVKNHEQVGGLLLRYEDLKRAETRTRLENYLDLTLADATSLARVRDKARVDVPDEDARHVPRLERFLLKRAVEPIGSRLGYV